MKSNIFICTLLIMALMVSSVFAQRGGQRVDNIASSTLPKTAEEKTILAVINELEKTKGEMLNVPTEDGRLLRLLTEVSNAKHVVEIGTSNGYSGLWFCLALRVTGGKLTTFEIDHDRVLLAQANFKKAGVEKIVTIMEGDAHNEVTKLKDPIDVVFLDADKSGYSDYLNKLLPLVKPGGLIIAHNMRSPAPDPDYIKAITTNPDLETIFLNMQAAGVGVTLKKR
ncbi:MAG: O-methyltransferase [Candidatus Poribacteria bacterium]